MQYKDVVAMPAEKPLTPKRPNLLFRTLVKIASASELKATHFVCDASDLNKVNQPCLILMNHSSFIDLKIASTVLYPRKFNIVMTSDGFVGKRWLMRNLGCIPTEKFITDAALVRNMVKCLRTLKTSVLLFPEASYTFDGTATPLPHGVGKLVKYLQVPVVMIRTHGAFLRDPLYNNLQTRKVDVSANVKYLLTPQQISELSADEINNVLKEQFTFDSFAEQQQNGIVVDEPFRADYLDRVLYKCPHCLAEGRMEGAGSTLVCKNCNKSYTLDIHGFLRSDDNCEFSLVSDWYRWQRECVRQELLNNTYLLDIDVDIIVKKGIKAVYKVGEGHLRHDINGFSLTGCDGQLNYFQPPEVSYSLYSDFYWYEIGDVICIGNSEMLYYCFPKNVRDVVAKTRLATEELYKIVQNAKTRNYMKSENEQT